MDRKYIINDLLKKIGTIVDIDTHILITNCNNIIPFFKNPVMYKVIAKRNTTLAEDILSFGCNKALKLQKIVQDKKNKYPTEIELLCNDSFSIYVVANGRYMHSCEAELIGQYIYLGDVLALFSPSFENELDTLVYYWQKCGAKLPLQNFMFMNEANVNLLFEHIYYLLQKI